MANRVQRYRVIGSAMTTLIGLEGEIIVNLTRFSAHVHDGITEGGFELALADASNIQDAEVGQVGRMTSAQVVELANATANIAANLSLINTNIADIGTNAADIATLQTGKADKVAPSAINNVALLSAGGNLVDSGALLTDAGLEVGTRATFNQTNAPIGWVKVTTHDNKAFRVVSGAVVNGGADGFSTVFGSGKATLGHLLTGAESGTSAHLHPYNRAQPGISDQNNDTGGSGLRTLGYATQNTSLSVEADALQLHSHDLTMNLAYVDMILCVKQAPV